MELFKAQHLANGIVSILQPYCDDIKVAGHIRRQKAFSRDIDIICIPKRTVELDSSPDLFGGTIDHKVEKVHPEFVRIVNSYARLKGEPTGKLTQRIIDGDGTKMNLHMVYEDNWGLMLAMCTGSPDYVHFILGRAWQRMGYGVLNGQLIRYYANSAHQPDIIPVPTEQELYKLIGLKYAEPQEREYLINQK